jgi:histidinol-phosphate aminotransferase
MKSSFFCPTLSGLSHRIAPAKQNHRLLLDKNEQSLDVPSLLKQNMLAKLMETPLNRYPEADTSRLESKIADYCGLQANQIAAAPGSAAIITTLLNYFGLQRKRIIINQPSYSLFEYHCSTYNIPFEPWNLNENLEFDINSMPVPDDQSVVIITSPNNPVGNAIAPEALEYLLTTYPKTLFILDAVYAEFGEYDFTAWVNQFENLMILRSFSKAFPVAGIRLGYLCATSHLVQVVKKLLLPFSINAFTQAFAHTVLFDTCFMEECRQRVTTLISERERLYRFIRMYFDKSDVQVYASQGNFLLLRFGSNEVFQQVKASFDEALIKTLPVSGHALMQNCIRITVGTALENDLALDALVQGVSANNAVVATMAA